jgi:hypothetical protein
MAACILILIWVQDELSYDRFHANSDRIFRAIEHEELSGGETLSYSQQSPALGPVLKSEYPEILESVRYDRMRNRLVQYGDHQFYEQEFSFVDPEFLTVFTFPLKVGDPETALKDPASIVISERMAKKYFNQSDPMGKVLRVDNRVEFIVSGVMENVPENSHLQFEFLAPFVTIKQFGQSTDDWDDFYLDIYVLLAENVDYHDVNAKIRNVISEHSRGDTFIVDLQPLKRIRLFSNAILTPQVDGDIKYVVIFSLIAVFILLNACINFMNLTTARSGRRAKEIGCLVGLSAWPCFFAAGRQTNVLFDVGSGECYSWSSGHNFVCGPDFRYLSGPCSVGFSAGYRLEKDYHFRNPGSRFPPDFGDFPVYDDLGVNYRDVCGFPAAELSPETGHGL